MTIEQRAVVCKAWMDVPQPLRANRLGLYDCNGLPDFAGPYVWLWRGWLLELVRRAWGDESAAVWRADSAEGRPTYWEVTDRPASLPCVCYGHGETEIEALVCALEAAP